MFDVLAFYGEMFSSERFLVGAEGQKHRARRAKTCSFSWEWWELLLPRDAQLEVQGGAAHPHTAITEKYLDWLFFLVELGLLAPCTFFFFTHSDRNFWGSSPGRSRRSHWSKGISWDGIQF